MSEYNKYTDDDRYTENNGYEGGNYYDDRNSDDNYNNSFDDTYAEYKEVDHSKDDWSSYVNKCDDNIKTPKKRKFFKKAAAFALSAVLFGSVAGTTMVGIQYAANKNGIIGNQVSETIQSTDTKADSLVKDATVSENASSTSKTTTSTTDVSSIAEKVLPSVVSITNSQLYENYYKQNGNWNSFFYGGQNYDSSKSGQEIPVGAGSGIIIGQNDTELLVVTNYHVIEDADALTLTFIDSSTAKASVKGTDEDNDLAVVAVKLTDLKEKTKKEIAVAKMNSSNDLKVGNGVVAIGNALGYGQSVTVGYISALNRDVQVSKNETKQFIQTDAAINSGNSGGALVNMDGEVIGINSAKYSDTGVEGMGFAIPISAVHNIIDDLMTQQTKDKVDEAKRGYLGIKGSTVDSSSAQIYGMPEGVYVYSILNGGAASKSELKERDVITKIDGKSVNSMDDLTSALEYYAVGDKAKLTVSRLDGNEYKDVEVTITLAKQVSE